MSDPEKKSEFELKGEGLSSCRAFAVRRLSSENLIDAENKIAENMAEKPRQLFCMGRHAARLGLAEIGANRVCIDRGESGAPIWPHGVVGSISHTPGMAVAVVAPSSKVRGVGIDIENKDRQFNLAINKKILTPAERLWAETDPRSLREITLCVLSAKEAVYKAFFPLESIFFGFKDAELTPTKTGFSGILKKRVSSQDPEGTPFAVSIQHVEKFIVTFITFK